MKVLKFIILGIFFLYFQIIWGRYFSINRIIPNFLLGYLFVTSIKLELKFTLTIAFFLGLMYDVSQPNSLGFCTISFVLIANFVNRFHHNIHKENFFVIFLSILLISAFYILLNLAFQLFTVENPRFSINSIIFSFVYFTVVNLIISLILLFIDQLGISFNASSGK
ncbi:MAG: rod shape-determining protein MreD [Candidatus Cloacimonetes bacterium]|nr:rod shape-determining protein MreD [Candidatus Cloacimonadota bacterium]